MTRLLTIPGTITITGPRAAHVDADVITTDEAWSEMALSVSDLPDVAHAQRYQQIGVRVQVERAVGDGVMLTLPDHFELGKNLTITESTRSLGDMLTFTAVGERFSPLARGLLRQRAKVMVSVVYGFGVNEYRRNVFTGWIVQAQFDVQPPTSQVVALDAQALYAERRAPNYFVPANSGKTRGLVTRELLAIGGIVAGSMDFGQNDGGVISKSVTLGDKTILEFLREYLAVIGVDIYFAEGVLVAVRFDPDEPHVAELNSGNLCLPLGLKAPDTLAPNVTGIVSTKVTRSPVGGPLPAVPNVTTIVGTHGRETAAERQYAGAMVAFTPPPAGPYTETLSEVHTVTQQQGGVEVNFEEWELGWWNPLAARSEVRQVDPHTDELETRPRESGSVYIYEDGSVHRFPQAVFTEIRRVKRVKIPDANGYITRIVERKYGIARYRRALTKVNHGLSGAWIPVGEDGQGMVDGLEVYGGVRNGEIVYTPPILTPDEIITTDITLDAEQRVIRETITREYRTIGDEVRRANSRFGYGTENMKFYARESEISGFGETYTGRDVTTRYYRATTGDAYVFTEIVTLNGAPPTAKTSDAIAGSLPTPERFQKNVTTQEIRATVDDDERIALAGERITGPSSVEHNEWIENDEEAATYARIRARKAAAIVLTCEVSMEARIHKYKPVLVKLAGASIDREKFYVQEVVRNLGTFRESLVCERYPVALS